ncbi:MAG: IPT/TIG domain-containing protein, partial [Gemmatimonadota bacterium]
MYRPKVSFGSIVMTLAASIAFAGCGGDDDGTGPGISLQPDVVAVTPDSGNVGTLVGITGSNFQTGAAVAFGPLSADSVVFVDAGTLLAYAPAGVQRDSVYAVEVTNPGGKSDALPAAYKAVSPVLSALNGVSKPSGNTGSTVILEGKSFGDLLGVSQVFFTDGSGQPVEAAVTLPENWTNEFIVTTVPSAAATGPVWIETPLGMTGSIEFRLLQAATFSPSLINWTETTPLPDASQGHEAVFLPIEGGPGQGNLIYLTGGADGTVSPRNRVAYAEVDASSQLSVWTDETTLPEPRAFHGAAA